MATCDDLNPEQKRPKAGKDNHGINSIKYKALMAEMAPKQRY
jgi:hypothetical protein